MSEQGDDEAKYRIRWEVDGKVSNSSRDRSGKASAEYFNGDKYEGLYKDGVTFFSLSFNFPQQRQGKGHYTWKNGIEYTGDYVENKKHGFAKVTYKQFGSYFGFYENGRRHGEGTFHYANGDSYSGWWKYGVKCGEGTYTYAKTGMRLQGTWENNQISFGKWIFPDGKYYEGPFANCKPSGKGKWCFKDGNVVTGDFKQALDMKEDEDEDDGGDDQGDEDNVTIFHYQPLTPKLDPNHVKSEEKEVQAQLGFRFLYPQVFKRDKPFR